MCVKMNYKTSLKIVALIIVGIIATSFIGKKKVITVYLIGDSTVADYTLYEEDYRKERYPVTGWGQVFQPFMSSDSLKQIRQIIKGDSVIVDDRARGGRSTRTFFEEGRWRAVFDALKKDDVVLMQFGHNDAAKDK